MSVYVDEIKKNVLRETYSKLASNEKIIWHFGREMLRKDSQVRDPEEGGKNYIKINLKFVRYEGKYLN